MNTENAGHRQSGDATTTKFKIVTTIAPMANDTKHLLMFKLDDPVG